MGPISRRSAMVRIGLFVAALLLLSTRARAACFESINFGQFSSACSGGTADCYVLSPGFNTPESIVSSFWSLHGGNLALGLGTDNGSWEAPEAWLHASPLGNWLNGSWSDAPGIDGCIGGQFPPGKPSEIMVTGFSDTDVFGTHGYFAVATVRRYAAQWPQFDFAAGVGQDLELKPIPHPEFYLFTRIGIGAWRAQVRSPNAGDLAGGFYTDGSTGFSEAVVGYRIYKREASNGWPPSDRHRSGWTPVTGVVPFGQMASFDYLCLSELITYFATSLVFDSGFETGYVSSNSLPVKLCLDCRDDLDGDGWSYGEICGFLDCNDDDPSIYPGAPEVNDGKDNQCPGSPGYGSVDEISGAAGFYHPGDTTKLTWLVQDGASEYEVARSGVRDFSAGCLGFTTHLPTLQDTETPQAGSAFYYLVRATAPHMGSWGRNSSGIERAITCSQGR